MLSRTTHSHGKDQLVSRTKTSPKGSSWKTPRSENIHETATDFTWCSAGCWRMRKFISEEKALPCRQQPGGMANTLKGSWSLPSGCSLQGPCTNPPAPKPRCRHPNRPRFFPLPGLLTCCSLTIQQMCNQSLSGTKQSLHLKWKLAKAPGPMNPTF